MENPRATLSLLLSRVLVLARAFLVSTRVLSARRFDSPALRRDFGVGGGGFQRSSQRVLLVLLHVDVRGVLEPVSPPNVRGEIANDDGRIPPGLRDAHGTHRADGRDARVVRDVQVAKQRDGVEVAPVVVLPPVETTPSRTHTGHVNVLRLTYPEVEEEGEEGRRRGEEEGEEGRRRGEEEGEEGRRRGEARREDRSDARRCRYRASSSSSVARSIARRSARLSLSRERGAARAAFGGARGVARARARAKRVEGNARAARARGGSRGELGADRVRGGDGVEGGDAATVRAREGARRVPGRVRARARRVRGNARGREGLEAHAAEGVQTAAVRVRVLEHVPTYRAQEMRGRGEGGGGRGEGGGREEKERGGSGGHGRGRDGDGAAALWEGSEV